MKDDVPDPRPDGKCADCGSETAVTNDGRFCRKCIRQRIRAMPENQLEKGRLFWRNSEMRDRPMRETDQIGESSVDMRTTEDMP